MITRRNILQINLIENGATMRTETLAMREEKDAEAKEENEGRRAGRGAKDENAGDL